MEREIQKELSDNLDELLRYVDENISLLNEDQKFAYNTIMNAFHNNGGFFFLDAPGGTGKTFLINLILASIRKDNKIAIAVASSGAAATLLHGGRTAHSFFKLPLDLVSNDTASCNISKGSAKAKFIQMSSIIMWDEISMMHKHGLEAVDRTLRDLCNNQHIMGGKVLVLAGDFRQILPVVQRGTMYDEIKACVKTSSLWNNIKTLKLRTNMRARLSNSADQEIFANQLLQLGEGRWPKDMTDIVTFPDKFCSIVKDVKELLENIFPNIN
jgi:ATP-dependent DNA helicase PIF1